MANWIFPAGCEGINQLEARGTGSKVRAWMPQLNVVEGIQEMEVLHKA
jgi:hypothetical protein